MRGVGVLILVNEDVFEFAVIFRQHFRVGLEDADGVQEQVAEVAGVQRLQPVLIGLVELAALAVGEGPGVALGNFGGAKPLVFPAIDHLGELARRPALVVEVFRVNELLDQADLVVGIENGEA